MKIVVAIPTATGQIYSQCVQTLLSVRGALRGKGIRTSFLSIALSDVIFARNYLAARFLEDKAASHLFFIDSDMQFQGTLALRLLREDKDLIGAVYPKRTLSFDKLKRNLAQAKGDFDDALALSHDYVVRPARDAGAPENGLLPVAGIGMGATLARRAVFQAMIEKGAAKRLRNTRSYRDAGLKPPIHDFFGPVTTERGDALSEDFSFCHRWTDGCGGRVWAVVDADIGHVGTMRFAASYARYLALAGDRQRIRLTVKPAAAVKK